MDNTNIGTLYRNLKPRLRALEKERIELSKNLDKLKKFSILGSAAVVVISFPWLGIMSPIFFGAVGIAVYAVLYHRMKKNYRQGYKDKVFNELIDELGPQYSYDLNGAISDHLTKQSGLFHDFNNKKSEDFISGKFDDHSFELAEINLFKNTKSKNSDHRGTMQFIFKGLFFVGRIPLEFPTKIWILSKNYPKIYDERRIKNHWQKVELKHLAFGKEYVVYAADMEIANQILKDNILDTILETRQKIVDVKMRMELSFQGNQVFLSISTVKELFEPPINTSILDKEDFQANFKYLVNTTGLLQQLTLVKA